FMIFFFSSRRRHTRLQGDWSSDVCSSDLFGLGYSTTSRHAWVNGGSPTKGFLAHVEAGPIQGLLRDWAGQGWADWLFMIGLAALDRKSVVEGRRGDVCGGGMNNY